MDDLLKKVSSSLVRGKEQKNKCFYVEQELNPSEVHVKIQGVGEINLPPNQEVIQQLIDISSKAKFGLREQTLLDETIRATQEITADQLSITINQAALAPMLANMRDDLGLSADVELIPHLHNMLIYTPGQFFNKHQDSEKLENMVATLVMVLPSPQGVVQRCWLSRLKLQII